MAIKIMQLLGLAITCLAAVVFFCVYTQTGLDGGELSDSSARWMLASIFIGAGGIGLFVFGRLVAWLKR